MNFLVLLEKNQNAILGTLIVHILIFVWLNIQNVSFYIIQPKEKVLATLDFTAPENNLIPKETLFIDDSIQHIHSANKMGIKTYLIDQNKSIIDLFPDIIQQAHH